MKKIALLKCEDWYDDLGDRRLNVLDSMWHEVEDEELQLLREHVHKLSKYPICYMIAEWVPPETLTSMLDQLREIAAREKTEAEQRDARRKADAERSAAKRKATELERKRKQLAKLQKELGEGSA